jgi:hypothetical protein
MSRKNFCRAFIDDIIIFSDNVEDHLRHLDDVFEVFREKNIAISPAKSYIGYPSVVLLGFYVDAFGLATTDSRIQGSKDIEFHLVPDAVSRLPAKGDYEARAKEETPVLDDLWDPTDLSLVMAEARMPDDMRARFANA